MLNGRQGRSGDLKDAGGSLVRRPGAVAHSREQERQERAEDGGGERTEREREGGLGKREVRRGEGEADGPSYGS